MTTTDSHRRTVRNLRIAILVVALIAVAVTIWAVHALFFSGDTGISSARPSAAPVEEHYVTALSKGDAKTASKLDAKARAEWLGSRVDETTVLSNSTLSGAVTRIDHPHAYVTLASSSNATVHVTVGLAGHRYSTLLRVDWDTASKSWRLEAPLANVVEVTTATRSGIQGHPAFVLAGTASGSSSRYAVYPGVYRLNVDVAASKLVDPQKAPPIRDLTVVPFDAVPMKPIAFALSAEN